MRRTPLTIDQIPKPLIAAILSTEDQRFFEHAGIDFLGLLRAGVELILTGTKSQGGSTITMQVARNFYLGREKTFARKINEILLAMKIDRQLSKEKVLELYLNKIYLGKRAYGVASAAQVYFGKSLNELNLAEMAMIAGLPKAPSTLNPVVNPIAAKKRRDHVLERMYSEGYITEKTYREAIALPLIVNYHPYPEGTKAPYVAEMVRNLMVTSFGADAYTNGYRVYTTINSQQQNAANIALRDGLLAYDQRHGYRGPEKKLGATNQAKEEKWQSELNRAFTINGLHSAIITAVEGQKAIAILNDKKVITLNWDGLSWARIKYKNHWGTIPKKAADILKIGDFIRVVITNKGWRLAQIPEIEGAIVAMDPQTGAINALVGGFDYSLSNFNRVTQAQRQPGSGFKPFIYAAAFDKGFTLSSLVNDAPLVFMNPVTHELWHPRNDDKEFRGPIRLRDALTFSINLVSIRLLEAVGLSSAMDYLKHFGFDVKKLPRNLTLALGSGSVTPLELVTSYAVLANGGYKISPYVIDYIEDSQGKIIYQAQPKVACTECVETGIPSPSGSVKYATQTISSSVAFLTTSALQDVIRRGTGYGAMALGRKDLAGKTGTTNDQVDTWFTGYNADIVASVWVGFDQPRSVREYGAKMALPMWVQFMRTALAGKPEHSLPQPPDVITAKIDPKTGLLTKSDDGIIEYFKENNLPAEEGFGVSPSVYEPHKGGEEEIEPLF
ncbi:MAG: Penicillin-binding protein 1A [Legionellaceae bacterium]